MKRISFDNGLTFLGTSSEIKKKGYDVRRLFPEIVDQMNSRERENVHAMGITDEVEFLIEYLKIASWDIII